MRSIPSIEQLRQRPAMLALEMRYGRAAVVDALRAEAVAARDLGTAAADAMSVADAIERGAVSRLATEGASLRRVINATGVIIHTNLGRAPLARAAAERAARLASGYTNLEYDLDNGGRGRRDVHAERLLCRLAGAEAAVVVNNNAAATLLVLAATAFGREVIISRGELVEIGGGFRVPDVLAQSGAVLREVGTTNRTRAADYAAAIGDRTALILRVHPSNFRIEGFTERPTVSELADVGHRFNVPVAEDLGSGYLGPAHLSPFIEGSRGLASAKASAKLAEASPESEATRRRPTPARGRSGVPLRGASLRPLAPAAGALGDEPIVSRSLAAGADVVMFSGDKLLGGPQAGIIAGRESLVARIRVHPLMRALRVDKLTYAALEATLEEFAAGRAQVTVPVATMLAMPIAEIARRARTLADALSSRGVQATVVDGDSTIGGGSAPGTSLPTKLVVFEHPTHSANGLERHLRRLPVPIIARVEHDRVVFDLRTVDPEDDTILVGAFDGLGT